MRPKRYALTVPIYGCGLWLTVGGTAEQWNRHVRRRHKVSPGMTSEHIGGCCEVPTGVAVWLGETDPDTVTHELVHAGVFVLARVGVPFSARADEALAYIVGALAGMVWPRLGC